MVFDKLDGQMLLALRCHAGTIGETLVPTKKRSAIIQDCINAITAEGARVREGANDSWRGGMFYAAEVLRKLRDTK